MKRRLLAFAMVLTMAMGMIGCGSEQTGAVGEESKDGYTIAVLLPGPTGYFVATKEGVDAAAAENDVTIEYADAEWDAGRQLSQAEDFITKGVDLIALCCVDSASAEKIVKSAQEAENLIQRFLFEAGLKQKEAQDDLLLFRLK